MSSLVSPLCHHQLCNHHWSNLICIMKATFNYNRSTDANLALYLSCYILYICTAPIILYFTIIHVYIYTLQDRVILYPRTE